MPQGVPLSGLECRQVGAMRHKLRSRRCPADKSAAVKQTVNRGTVVFQVAISSSAGGRRRVELPHRVWCEMLVRWIHRAEMRRDAGCGVIRCTVEWAAWRSVVMSRMTQIDTRVSSRQGGVRQIRLSRRPAGLPRVFVFYPAGRRGCRRSRGSGAAPGAASGAISDQSQPAAAAAADCTPCCRL